MTEDPVKLYVVVMAILLGVLCWVAWSSYQDAAAYEQALESADSDAKRLRRYASEVQTLCDQLGRSGLGQGPRTLIARAANLCGIRASSIGGGETKRISGTRRGQEIRFQVTFGGRGSPALDRKTIAKFCQAVERDSQGIYRTIEIQLTREQGRDAPAPGTVERVEDDRYRGKIVFGKRYVE